LLHLTTGLFEKIVVCGFPSYVCEVSHCSPPLLWAMGTLWWAFSITHVVVKVAEHVSCLHGYQTPPHLSLKLLNGFNLFLLIFSYMIFLHIHLFMFSIAFAQLVVFFSCAHVQMFCTTNECDSDSKEWCFLPKQMVTKNFCVIQTRMWLKWVRL
jgi:hypothetical protein